MKRRFFLVILSVISGLCLGFLIDYQKHGSFAWATKAPNPNFSNPSWTTGLVGYWSFDGQYTTNSTTTDQSNNGNTGTLTGGVKPIAGISGQALSFDGVNDYINLGTDSSLKPTFPVTLSAWVKSNDITRNGTIVANDNFRRASGNSCGALLYQSSAGKIVARFGDCTGNGPGNTNLKTGNTTLTQNVWYYVVGVIRGANDISIYINGIDDGGSYTYTGTTLGYSSSYGSIGDNFLIGTYFNGLIDEVRIYNRALSAEEVLGHYNFTRRKFQVASSNPNDWSNGLVGYWSFDGQTFTNATTSLDLSGNNNTSTLVNGVTPKAGISGQALSFDGVDDYVDKNVQLVSAYPFTMEAWFKTQTTGVYQTVFSLEDKDVGYRSYNIGVDSNNKAWMRSRGNDTQYNIVSINSVTDGNWHFLTGVWESATVRNFYLDGVYQGQSTTTDNFQSAIDRFSIGRCGDSTPDNYFNGLIDEVRIYDRALSAEEVASHYNLTRRKFQVASSNPNDWTNGLVGYWSMDGQNTTSSGTRDLSGNNNYGLFSGGVGVSAGISGQALSFDGVNDYVQVSHSATLEPTDVTISFWVKPTIWSGNHRVLIAKRSAESNGYFVFALSSTRAINFDWGGSGYRWASGYSPPLGQWTFITLTRSSSGRILYVNGVYNNSTADAGASVASGAVLRIGYDSLSQYPYSGFIDEVRIYNRALSAEEILEHYNTTKRSLGL